MRLKLITPAMASDPYGEEAPSRSTSMLAIAVEGMVARSGPCVPEPPICTREAR